MAGIRDIFLALITALMFVQFLPRIEPARIPSTSASSPAQPSSPGLLQRFQESFNAVTSIRPVSFSDEATRTDIPSEGVTRSNPASSGRIEHAAGFRPVANRANEDRTIGDRPAVDRSSAQKNSGEQALLFSGGRWMSVEIVRPCRQGYIVRFPGQSVSYMVPTAELRFPVEDAPDGGYSAPVSAHVWHCRQWCACDVLQRDEQMYLIHLDGAPSHRREWVNQRTLRFSREATDSHDNSHD